MIGIVDEEEMIDSEMVQKNLRGSVFTLLIYCCKLG